MAAANIKQFPTTTGKWFRTLIVSVCLYIEILPETTNKVGGGGVVSTVYATALIGSPSLSLFACVFVTLQIENWEWAMMSVEVAS